VLLYKRKKRTSFLISWKSGANKRKTKAADQLFQRRRDQRPNNKE